MKVSERNITIQKNRIYQMDCLEGMKLIPDKSIDMILCDLPYGTTKCKWGEIIPFKPLWDQYERIIKDNGAIVLTAAQPFTSSLVSSNLKLFRYSLVWEKSKSSGFLNAKRMPLRSHEEILVFYKKLPTYNPQKTTGHKPANTYTKHTNDGTNYGKTKQGIAGGGQTDRYPTSVWKIPVMNNDDPRKFHPTQKPIELYERIIKTFSNQNQLVLDNCSGAGTIAIACINTGRNYIGFEWNEECPEQYYNPSVQWIKNHIDMNRNTIT